MKPSPIILAPALFINPKNAAEPVTDPPSALRLRVWTFARVLIEWVIWIAEA